MPANSSNAIVHYWSGKYEGQKKIGWLVSPPIEKTKLRPWIPFALDNGAFPAWQKKLPFPEAPWLKMINHVKLTRMTPLWALVPDVVANRDETLKSWYRYRSVIDEAGWVKAFAVQDGMTTSDVPEGAEVIFVGGTDEWKWKTVSYWCSHHQHIHVGRVNSLHRIEMCHRLGVKSVDGSGWFRATDGAKKVIDLSYYMAHGPSEAHPELLLGV